MILISIFCLRFFHPGSHILYKEKDSVGKSFAVFIVSNPTVKVSQLCIKYILIK